MSNGAVAVSAGVELTPIIMRCFPSAASTEAPRHAPSGVLPVPDTVDPLDGAPPEAASPEGAPPDVVPADVIPLGEAPPVAAPLDGPTAGPAPPDGPPVDPPVLDVVFVAGPCVPLDPRLPTLPAPLDPPLQPTVLLMRSTRPTVSPARVTRA